MNGTKFVVNKDFITREMERRKISSFNELARQIGMSESTFHKVMSGDRNPGGKVISMMLTYFGVTFEKIFIEVLTKVHKTA